MKKLFSFVCALVCAMSLSAQAQTKTIYLSLGSIDWGKDGAIFKEAVSGKSMTAVDGKSGYYQVAIEEKQETVTFQRISPNNGTVWNKHENLTIPDGKDLYTLADWNNNGTWSVFADAPATQNYFALHGNFTGDWKTTEFTFSEDGATATLTMQLTAKPYEFGARIGGAGNWTSNGQNITRDNNTTDFNESGEGNNKMTADVTGEYVFTYTVATKVLTVTYPASTGGDPTPDPEPTYNYYLVGTAAENGWNEGQAMPMVDDQIVRSLAAGVYEFKILTTLGEWDGALGYSDVNEECSSEGYKNNNGNVKIVLAKAGDVTIKVVKGKICVTGEIGGTVTISSYTICGPTELVGSDWNPSDTNNDMTETTTGIWTLTKKNLTLEATDYEYKMVANHQYGVKDIPTGYDNNNKLTITTAGIYEVTFTFNAATDELSAVAKANPTDLSNTEVENAAVKVIRNGQVLIVREGVTYNMMGQVIQ